MMTFIIVTLLCALFFQYVNVFCAFINNFFSEKRQLLFWSMPIIPILYVIFVLFPLTIKKRWDELG